MESTTESTFRILFAAFWILNIFIRIYFQKLAFHWHLLLVRQLVDTGLYFLTLTWMYLGRVRFEEEMMLERFGERYRSYMQNTGRLIPKFFPR